MLMMASVIFCERIADIARAVRGRKHAADAYSVLGQGHRAAFGDNRRDSRFRSTRCWPYTYSVGEVAERLKAAVC